MSKLHELREQRAVAVDEMHAINDKSETEKRDLTADEDAKFGQLSRPRSPRSSTVGRGMC